MTRYFIKFSYLGTLYSGMQKNIVKNTNIQIYDIDTIQGAIESAFSTLIPKCAVWPRLTCCSRTDHGVHAIHNLAHIDVKNKYSTIYNPVEALRYVNRYLINCSHNIRVLEAIPVKNTFHVRKCANSRTYLYRVLRAKNKNDHKIPIIEMDHCLHLKSDTFDPERIKRAIQLFMGTKDFRTFSAKTISNKPIKYVRNLYSLTFEKGSPLMPFDPLSENFEFWEFKCSAKSFLYKQVRRIVGTLIALGTGQITEKDIVVMLQVPGHHNFLPILRAAPSNGLYLLDVGYNQEYLDEHIIKYKISDNGIVIPLDETEV
ncbi:tRNA pseudouridine synthase-like 1 isoform X1 [Bombus terrestris]|uniref:tRNA pseudouridine synthase n=1 Tax=Bombus terrestris TaxID=30195 RepID=A0A9B0F1W9_BOMTE|nr:tRNA pseudouridine synthase-like 1 isoform X1 [Bombus terrestris]